MPAARPLEPILWAGAMFAAVLLGISLRFLAFLVILPWSVLVWPLHRQRARASMAWPPPYALEVWQTALGASLVALATFVAAWVTDHDFFGTLFVPVAFLAAGLSAIAVAMMTYHGVVASREGGPQEPGSDG